MAGHSKWANIRHRKAQVDAQRGKLFAKVIRAIITAAREGGGDPEKNPRLRLAIQWAREVNMPSENVKRAIQRGTGEIPGAAYEEVSYEGYGPGGVAVLVEAMTDNRNRTTAEIRHIFSRYGGSLGEVGCVSWVFERKGILSFEGVSEDKVMEVALDAGAEDVRVQSDGTIEVITDSKDFMAVREAFEKAKIKPVRAEVTMIPKSTTRLEGEDAVRMLKLMEALEDHDDVQHVYANFDIPDEIMEKIGAAA
ncbi:MAG: YebC/PmpR family DNA-binding transcriptional regulator [Synergistetes bacterium]|nr:YebC/PmpR family DNA-binding transcriptional regulator [Synergistota bacterium]MCX8127201.1 YebC/PmpR family DNA-binding transcriptional regulator [Synergistota bacterium]MDW8191913.1 YebC/PmpR family DNA-binding transcriptional regulator [Synergistota bacterium]